MVEEALVGAVVRRAVGERAEERLEARRARPHEHRARVEERRRDDLGAGGQRPLLRQPPRPLEDRRRRAQHDHVRVEVEHRAEPREVENVQLGARAGEAEAEVLFGDGVAHLSALQPEARQVLHVDQLVKMGQRRPQRVDLRRHQRHERGMRPPPQRLGERHRAFYVGWLGDQRDDRVFRGGGRGGRVHGGRHLPRDLG